MMGGEGSEGNDGDCWVEKQTNHWTGEWMMLDCAWGSWRVMSQRKGEEEGEGEEKEKEKENENERKSADV